MICKKCNSKIEVPAKFCVYCGAPLEEVEPTTTLNPLEPVVSQPIESGVVQQTNTVEQVIVQPIETSTTSEPTINTVEQVVTQPIETSAASETTITPVEVNVTESSDQNTGVEVANKTVANVGISANDVGKTKKKKNNTWIIVVLVILVLGLGGYLVYDKVITKDVKEEAKEESSNQESKEYDLAEAKKLINKYSLDYFMFSRSLFNENMTESHKIVIAINHTKNSDINYSCKDAFSEIKLQDGQYIIETDEFWGSCYEKEENPHVNDSVYTYESVNKTYKELFGEKQDLPKQFVSFYTYRYAYSEKYDAYIEFSCECGIGGYMLDFHYDVDKAIVTNDTLEIFVNYVEFEYDENNKKVYVSKKYDINVDSEDEFGVAEEELEKLYDRAIKELDEKQITKYKFTFKKSGTGYYLESIVNELY